MKKSLTVRLILMFAAVLCVYALTATAMFSILSRRQLLEQNTLTLRRNAYNIAKSLVETLRPQEDDHDLIALIKQNTAMEYQVLLMERLTQADLWIVDRNHAVATHQNDTLAFIDNATLPFSSEKVLSHVFWGKTYNDSFLDKQNGKRFLTVGTPVTNRSGEIIGAVMLYAPLRENIDGLESGNTLILIGSLLFSLLLCGLLGIYLSYRFNLPIVELEKTALTLSGGNYKVNTHIKRDDELGQLASAIDQLAFRLDEAKTEQEQAEKNRRTFLSNISHELKTPVTVLRASLESLCDNIVVTPQDVARFHTQMLTESKQLERLILDLLDLTKLQNHEFNLTKEAVSLSELLGDVLISAKTLAASRKVRIVCEEPAKDWVINGDYGRLRQLVIILLDNAIKYSFEQGNVQLILHQNSPVMEVRDEGQGIDENLLPNIFERYYRGDSTNRLDGTGLGLSIAAEIARAHNAAIEVESRTGAGSSFKIKFAP
ncbi:MAG TPA: ATP-binding protein [Clostridia bacterium]|nr:ATP-binding protein [Clostridia bacterium]